MRSETVLPAILPWQLPTPDAWAPSDSYRLALAQLYGYSEAPRAVHEAELGRRRKLDRMRTLLSLLGSPQSRFATILVAGTKGKGSTAALLTSILEAAGYRVGRYTQPHLYSYRERIWASGRYITETELAEELDSMAEALQLVQRGAGELGLLTTFDVGTAQTLLHFVRAGVEVAVVEVGVGGANDATNALEPILALVGPVGMDHVETLGPTLGDIAREKAGIARRGIDVVVAPQEPEAMLSIRETVARRGARLHQLGTDAVRTAGGSCSAPFSVETPCGPVHDLTLPLQGPCQRENAAMAVTAARLLERLGWSIPAAAIKGGVGGVHWPGRFQTVVQDPLTLVDGAHNPSAARALVATVRECLPGRPVTLVLGMSTEKDAASFLQHVAPIVERAIVTRARHPRSCDPSQLADLVRNAGLQAQVAASPGTALASAWAGQPSDGVTLVTGSLFLVGDAMEWLLEGLGVGGWGLGSCDE